MRIDPAAVTRLRLLAGLSQTELGVKCGLTQASISRIERGQVDLSRPSVLRRLADGLGVTIADITRDDEPEGGARRERGRTGRCH